LVTIAAEDPLVRSKTRFRLSVLGGFSFKAPDGRDIVVSNRKACGLLCYIALKDDHRETRERLAGLLWSDRSENQARASLRQCLKHLRQVFDSHAFDGFVTNRTDISLSPDQFDIDLVSLSDLLKNGRLDEVRIDRNNTPGRIMYGFEGLDQSFSAWLHVIRQTWQDRFVERLQAALANNHGEASKHIAKALIAIDPTHEAAHCALIRHSAERGNTGAALRQYKTLWDLLGEEYDMEPGDEARALIAEIKAGTYINTNDGHNSYLGIDIHPYGQEPGEGKEAHLPVLRISAFNASRPDESALGIVAGFRQDLIASLVRFREWIVLDGSRTTRSALYDENGSERAGSVGTEYDIDGTYYLDNGEAHLVVTLRSVDDGRYVWSERVALTQENWFSAQRHFITRLSASLNIYLTTQSIARQIVSHEMSTDTYQLWLQAYRLIWSWDPGQRNRAERMFRQVVLQCPTFAPAYSGLASIFNTEQIIYPGVVSRPERLEEAATLAQAAVRLDPLDVRSQIALAWSLNMTGRFDRAAHHHRLVYELNPNNPTTLISCATGLAMCGDLESARRIAGEVDRFLPSINPVQWTYLAAASFVYGDYRECIARSDMADPKMPVTLGWRAAAVGLVGTEAEAAEAGRQFVDAVRPLWRNDTPGETSELTDWFVRAWPIKSRTIRDRIVAGLSSAGLPRDLALTR